MKDSEFKILNHRAKDYYVHLNGQELSKGYKRDFVLKRKDKYIIIESEVSTSRKGYIGGMVKAAKFLTGKNSEILIFVIQIRKNTTPEQIANHLRNYYQWIRELTRLKNVYIISDEDYCKSGFPIEIFSEKFIQTAKQV